MKKIKYLLILVVAVMVSVSCNTDDDDGVSALVGTWEMSDVDEDIEYSITVTFKASFSGTMVSVAFYEGESETDSESFTWSTDGNKLTLIIDGETEILTYSISGDKLTILDGGKSEVFTRL